MDKITIERETLLPCPFCGCGAAITGTEWGGREQYFVACTGPDCHCAVGENYDRDACPEYSFSSKDDAIAAWNRRAALAAQPTEPTMDTVLRNAARRSATVIHPGRLAAQPATTAVPPCHVAVIGHRFDPVNQTHVPQVLLEFEPVPVNSPNDAKGWQDRDALAAMIAAAGDKP